MRLLSGTARSSRCARRSRGRCASSASAADARHQAARRRLELRSLTQRPPPSTPPTATGSGARILSVGIAATGVFTFAYFALASHVLDGDLYGSIALLWSILFVVISVIYRPVEQLLSRTIAERRARGLHGGHPLRMPL